MATLLLAAAAAAAVIISTLTPAAAAPVPPPDLTRCHPALEPDNKTTVPCCIPAGPNAVVDFAPPPPGSPLRVRRPAHLADESYVAKYEKAVAAMRSLPPDHPWSHRQQANLHCAYCNGAYNMSGPYGDVSIQIHGSWLFFPFHRLYLHFHERILGKLVGDDSFSLPFWNWDHPAGMTLPAMFSDPRSALHDPFRDPAHRPPAVVDLSYNLTGPGTGPGAGLIGRNLRAMYRQVVRATTATLFLGSRYVAGADPQPGGGSVELAVHNNMHDWTGDRRRANGEDMGAFYSAARDPVFFAHHANVDRMWRLWSEMPGRNRRGFDDGDWLDASFVFWDENMRLVRARVRDCLDTAALGYTYQDVPVPWIRRRPDRPATVEKPEPTEGLRWPVRLRSAVTVGVKRPRAGRSREEREAEEEVLVVDGIRFVKAESVRFDVYVNGGPSDELGAETASYAGSFTNLPMGFGGEAKTATTRMVVGISELLSEIDAEGDDSIVVSLVPRRGNDVSVGDVRIEFSS